MTASPMRLRHQIDGAQDLQAVVRAMKAQAAAGLGQYERAVDSITRYADTVETGLGAALRATANPAPSSTPRASSPARGVRAVVFGSDQGLVGRFNDLVAELAGHSLAREPRAPTVRAVGERVGAALEAQGLAVQASWPVPVSVDGITGLVAALLASVFEEAPDEDAAHAPAPLHLFYNRPVAGHASACEPVAERLLPLDAAWERATAARAWPTSSVPQMMGSTTDTLRALIHEHLFVSLFRACASSLASENASRLAAMERADRNIDDRLTALQRSYHRVRQGRIDDELADVTAGFRALGDPAAADR